MKTILAIIAVLTAITGIVADAPIVFGISFLVAIMATYEFVYEWHENKPDKGRKAPYTDERRYNETFCNEK